MRTEGPRASTAGLVTLTAIVLAFLAAVPEFAGAAVRHVPEEYATIQGAVDASSAGDTVLLSPGTYRGVGNRDIMLHGYDLVIMSSAGPEATILDCERSGRGFYLDGHETRNTRIEGLTIQNGMADWGGAILVGVSSPTIANCRILNNYGYVCGGLFLSGFSGLVDHCLISGNQSLTYPGGGILYYFGDAEFTDCVITDNFASAGGACAILGSGIGEPVFRGCTVTCNGGGDGPGGFYGSHVTLERCIVWGNSSMMGDDEMDVGIAQVRCCDIDSTGVGGSQVNYDENCVFTNPMFCGTQPCDYPVGDLALHGDSPCLPEHSPCGELIGALGWGCGTPTPPGACCLVGGVCVVVSEYVCSLQQGSYQGNGTLCQPDPCGATPTERTSWGRIKAAFR
jgi:hypothetical protein